jgi:hypothetical protein
MFRHLGQVFVAIVHDLLGNEGCGRIGAQGVATVEAGAFGQRVLVPTVKATERPSATI